MRPHPRVSIPAALAVALAAVGLTACSGGATPAPSSVTASSSPTPSTTESVPAAITVAGADAALTNAVASVYAGKSGIAAKAAVGTWKKEKVAVVTAGADVTLAVRSGAAWKVVGGWWPSLGKAAQLGAGPRFVLVLGSDARPNQKLSGTRADTIQVIGQDEAGGGGIMGMARDIWAPMPGGGSAKINAAFSFGGGVGMTNTVKRVTGLPLEGYVVVGFKGAQAIVDEVGGLPIVIPKALVGKASHVNVKAGKQTLTGAQALAYARERKSLPNGDFDRSRHQGDLILAAAINARLQGPGSLAKFMTAVSTWSETDLSAAEALTFVAGFYRLDPTKVGRAVAAGSLGWSSDRQSIVVLDSAARAAFARFRDGRL